MYHQAWDWGGEWIDDVTRMLQKRKEGCWGNMTQRQCICGKWVWSKYPEYTCRADRAGYYRQTWAGVVESRKMSDYSHSVELISSKRFLLLLFAWLNFSRIPPSLQAQRCSIMWFNDSKIGYESFKNIIPIRVPAKHCYMICHYYLVKATRYGSV